MPAKTSRKDGCQEGRYPPSPAPTYILSMTFMAWNTLFGQFGSIILSVFLPASCICMLTRLGKPDSVLGLINNNSYHQSVFINILHIQNPKINSIPAETKTVFTPYFIPSTSCLYTHTHKHATSITRKLQRPKAPLPDLWDLDQRDFPARC